jgi:hypothetical protein
MACSILHKQYVKLMPGNTEDNSSNNHVLQIATDGAQILAENKAPRAAKTLRGQQQQPASRRHSSLRSFNGSEVSWSSMAPSTIARAPQSTAGRVLPTRSNIARHASDMSGVSRVVSMDGLVAVNAPTWQLLTKPIRVPAREAENPVFAWHQNFTRTRHNGRKQMQVWLLLAYLWALAFACNVLTSVERDCPHLPA